jgi:hypothetical protein
MGLGGLMYVPSFKKIGLGIQRLIREIHIQTHTAADRHRDSKEIS